MKIYTTYFAKLRMLPENIVPISIAAKNPPGWNGKTYRPLNPPWYILKNYKENNDRNLYVRCYKNIVLRNLIPQKVIQDLQSIACYEEKVVQKSDGYEIEKRPVEKDIALVCYEKPSDFCHRQVVADWLRDAGYDVQEWHPEIKD